MNVVRFRQKTALYEKTQLPHSVGCNSYIWEQKNKAEKPLKMFSPIFPKNYYNLL